MHKAMICIRMNRLKDHMRLWALHTQMIYLHNVLHEIVLDEKKKINNDTHLKKENNGQMTFANVKDEKNMHELPWDENMRTRMIVKKRCVCFCSFKFMAFLKFYIKENSFDFYWQHA